MFKLHTVSQAALLALGVAVSMPVFAQEKKDSKETETQKLDQVVITGSRIKSVGATSSSPINSVTREDLSAGQPVAIEEVIRSLPSASPAVGPGTNNGSGGGATINLRGLGSNRSLVLIDGRRMVPFNLDGQVDTNAIPVALLQRVDLVTGGASAVYGADAISGVANFVLRKKFDGVEITTSNGQSSQGDNQRRRVDITLGGSFDDKRGNIIVSGGMTKTTPLMVGDRDIGRTTLGSANGLFSGSPTSTPIVISVVPVTPAPANNTLGTGNRQLNTTTGAFEAYDAAKGSFNTNPANYFQTPLDRKQLTLIGNYEFGPKADLYVQYFQTESTVNSQLAESGTFSNTFNVPIGNAFIPEAARAQICSARGIPAASCVLGNTTQVPMVLNRRFVELGPRYNDFDNQSTQGTIGLRGELMGTWSYDASYTQGKATQLQTRRNWGSLSKVQQALNAVSTTTCANTANGCVPLNVFGPAGSITPQMLGFMNLSSTLNQTVEQTILTGSVSGDLGPWTLPTAKSPIGVALGFEQREVSAATKSDGPSQIQGEVLGTGAPTPDRRGTFKLSEFFGEAQVPLLEGLPLARRVSAELGVRATRFTTDTTRNYTSSKAGADWEPVKGLRIRGMQQMATRAPNVNELFAPQVTGLSNLATDPCQGTRINAADAAKAGTLSNLCTLTGVPTVLVGSVATPSSGQINVLSGGNPTLGPEKAKTTTVGLVFEPSAIKNLLVSVDYYRINVTDAISSPSTTDILDQCYNASFNPSFTVNAACSAIFRNPQNGTLNGVESKGVRTVASNQGKFWVSGVDVNVFYGFKLADKGRIDLSLSYNRMGDYKFQATPDSKVRDCKGYYSNACYTNLGPSHPTKWMQRGTWTHGDLSVGYNWRYMSAIQVEPGSGSWFAPYTKVKSYKYLDLNASYAMTKNVRLNLSVSNATNEQPPLVGNSIATTATNSGNTFPTLYDPVGRYFTLGATVKF